MNLQFLYPFLGHFAAAVGFLFGAAFLLLHILFAVCISSDLHGRQSRNRPVLVLTPFVWIFAVLFLGLIAIAFYWLCHYSRLTRKDF